MADSLFFAYKTHKKHMTHLRNFRLLTGGSTTSETRYVLLKAATTRVYMLAIMRNKLSRDLGGAPRLDSTTI